jgi:hypothetical protein
VEVVLITQNLAQLVLTASHAHQRGFVSVGV